MHPSDDRPQTTKSPKAPEADRSLIERMTALQNGLVDLRDVLVPFLNPPPDVGPSEELERPVLSPFETWIKDLDNVTWASLGIVRDIRERLYIPDVLIPQQTNKPE